jgi:hypothetical protein
MPNPQQDNVLSPQETPLSEAKTRLEKWKKNISPEQLSSIIREAQKTEVVAVISPELDQLRNVFGKENRERITSSQIKDAIKSAHKILTDAAPKTEEAKEILKALEAGCAFERYAISHINEQENVRNLMSLFFEYISKSLPEINERFAELMAGFPPIEENCVPGASARINDLLITRFVNPENTIVISAYHDAITSMVDETKDFVHDGNHIHLIGTMNWLLETRSYEELLRDDQFFKLPFSSLKKDMLFFNREKFREKFFSRIDLELAELEKYLGEFSISDESEFGLLKATLARFGAKKEGEDPYEESEETLGRYRVKSEAAEKLTKNAFGFLSKFESEVAYEPFISKADAAAIFNLETGQKIARALLSENDKEFLEAFRFLNLFAHKKLEQTFSAWQFHNIFDELLNTHHKSDPIGFLTERVATSRAFRKEDSDEILKRLSECFTEEKKHFARKTDVNGHPISTTGFHFLKDRLNGKPKAFSQRKDLISMIDYIHSSYPYKNCDQSTLIELLDSILETEDNNLTKALAYFENLIYPKDIFSVRDSHIDCIDLAVTEKILGILKKLLGDTPSQKDLNKVTKKFLNPLMHLALLKNKPEIFKLVLNNNLLPNGNHPLEISQDVLRAIVRGDLTCFIEPLAKSGYPKSLLLTKNYTFNMIHSAAILGRAKLISEIRKNFNLTKEDLQIKTDSVELLYPGYNSLTSKFDAAELAASYGRNELLKELKEVIVFSKRRIIPFCDINKFNIITISKENCRDTLFEEMLSRLNNPEHYPEDVKNREHQSEKSLKSADTAYFGLALGGSNSLDKKCKIVKAIKRCGGEELLERFKEAKANAENNLGIVATAQEAPRGFFQLLRRSRVVPENIENSTTI